jgi:hypothetical protein
LSLLFDQKWLNVFSLTLDPGAACWLLSCLLSNVKSMELNQSINDMAV